MGHQATTWVPLEVLWNTETFTINLFRPVNRTVG